jgi:hypothetical protein
MSPTQRPTSHLCDQGRLLPVEVQCSPLRSLDCREAQVVVVMRAVAASQVEQSLATIKAEVMCLHNLVLEFPGALVRRPCLRSLDWALTTRKRPLPPTAKRANIHGAHADRR